MPNNQEILLVLKALFHNPNKTLVNNLKNVGWENSKIADFMLRENLEKNIRLNWQNYQSILKKILEF